MQKPIALYLGRFQPFHNGHFKIIQEALKTYKVKVAIGSTEQGGRELRHPFTIEEREEMIRSTLKENNIEVEEIYMIPDIPDDEKYVDHVKSLCGEFDVIIAGEADGTHELFRQKNIPVISFGRFSGLRATDIRNLIIAGEPWEQHVPAPVLRIIQQIEGAERVRELSNKKSL